MKKVLKLLFNFVVTSLRIPLIMTLYWLSMLILSKTLIVVEYFKVAEYQLLDQFFYVKLCHSND
ncbi:hypothetical protein EZS27_011743 [termite gut metagenome]|uniref:Uncharacterized protein n=1 Tax=termite gut metagenome TaxID=433724 RepID=A0A5J4R9P6_9ZZZZ